MCSVKGPFKFLVLAFLMNLFIHFNNSFILHGQSRVMNISIKIQDVNKLVQEYAHLRVAHRSYSVIFVSKSYHYYLHF